MRLALSLAALVLGACSPSQPDPQPLSVRGVTYQVPKRDIAAMGLPPKDGSHLYVRVAPPGADYRLVLDEMSHYLPNNLGPNVPTVSRLNDNRFGKFTVAQATFGPVICSTGPQPHFNCGFRLQDGPVRWGVLFDKDRLGQAERIRTDAQAAVRSYRTN